MHLDSNKINNALDNFFIQSPTFLTWKNERTKKKWRRKKTVCWKAINRWKRKMAGRRFRVIRKALGCVWNMVSRMHIQSRRGTLLNGRFFAIVNCWLHVPAPSYSRAGKRRSRASPQHPVAVCTISIHSFPLRAIAPSTPPISVSFLNVTSLWSWGRETSRQDCIQTHTRPNVVGNVRQVTSFAWAHPRVRSPATQPRDAKLQPGRWVLNFRAVH